ncbi:MAG: T9SS type A sorting domain-containing protein [Candidatus Electryonea clarkiae]|nr:T9SS type A sorting domain-containing protein [Candidatus Electryonea clarkiae]MDP8286080.1 T9SS type A sorting domain-containing protein [Candidatus Electryonea clarkiae]
MFRINRIFSFFATLRLCARKNLFHTTLFLTSIFVLGIVHADPWADAVISVEFGTGAGFGQDYFPDNVLGSPDSLATSHTPSSDPQQLLTLGSGGLIVMAFLDGGIINEPGPDFTIFENPFYAGDSGFSYSETGIVSVSEDGEEWFEFPYDTLTFAGLAGVTPVNGLADPLDPEFSGGDHFDLDGVGLDQAQYIRIVDSEGFVQDSGPSFDLDAIAVLHGENGENTIDDNRRSISDNFSLNTFPNPFNSVLSIEITNLINESFEVLIFNELGQNLVSRTISGSQLTWDARHYSAGVYYLQVSTIDSKSMTKRIVLLK